MLNQNTQNDQPVRIKITIPTDVYFLAGLRNFTLDMSRNVAGFDEQWAYRFQTIVDELANNAIEHGSSRGDEIELLFEVERKKSMSITVSDSGHGPSQLSAADLQKRALTAKLNAGTPVLGLRGRGMAIMMNWCDALEYTQNERGGISVTAKKTYQPDEMTFHPLHSAEHKNVYVLEV